MSSDFDNLTDDEKDQVARDRIKQILSKQEPLTEEDMVTVAQCVAFIGTSPKMADKLSQALLDCAESLIARLCVRCGCIPGTGPDDCIVCNGIRGGVQEKREEAVRGDRPNYGSKGWTRCPHCEKLTDFSEETCEFCGKPIVSPPEPSPEDLEVEESREAEDELRSRPEAPDAEDVDTCVKTIEGSPEWTEQDIIRLESNIHLKGNIHLLAKILDKSKNDVRAKLIQRGDIPLGFAAEDSGPEEKTVKVTLSEPVGLSEVIDLGNAVVTELDLEEFTNTQHTGDTITVQVEDSEAEEIRDVITPLNCPEGRKAFDEHDHFCRACDDFKRKWGKHPARCLWKGWTEKGFLKKARENVEEKLVNNFKEALEEIEDRDVVAETPEPIVELQVVGVPSHIEALIEEDKIQTVEPPKKKRGWLDRLRGRS